MALVVAMVGTPAAHAADPVGTYATWSFSSTSSGSISVNPDPAWPTATVAVGTNGSGSAPTGTTTFLNAQSPMGQVFGSSENKTYASLVTSGSGATAITTVTFSAPTPASGWAFTVGEVDVEDVTIAATDATGSALDVSGWFAGTFNFCNTGSPKPSS